MKRVYENFTEIAEAFRNGESWTHMLSDHETKDCLAWQHGVMEFARWLDAEGVKIVSNPEIYPKLWEDTRTHKPDKFKECSKKGSDYEK